jgi:hypothetical protein
MRTSAAYASWVAGPGNNDKGGVWADVYTMGATAHVLKCNIVLIARERFTGSNDSLRTQLGQVIIQSVRDMYDPTCPTILLWHTGGCSEAHICPFTDKWQSASERNGFDRVHFQLVGRRRDGRTAWQLGPMAAQAFVHKMIDVATALIYESDNDKVLAQRPPMLHMPVFRLMFADGSWHTHTHSHTHTHTHTHTHMLC